MLKFLKEAAVYNFEHEGLRFVGLAHDSHVVCRVTKDALLACTDADDASATELMDIFDRYRHLFEDIAILEHAAGARDEINIDRFHLEQPVMRTNFDTARALT